ncbi:MAG: hypothetical protein OHK006_10350 [Thermodesulfovibrionales bacterium]
MEPLPDIVMQCPKCRKEHAQDVVYCETCSAMLEPVEKTQDGGSPPVHLKRKSADAEPDEIDRLEDIRIDSLKSDIEQRFGRTVLTELHHLNRRLRRKEPSMTAGAGSAALAGEAEVDAILQKIAKLEAIIENLSKKLEADISDLGAKISGTTKPALTSFFSSSARYYRAAVRQQRSKQRLLEAIRSRRASALPGPERKRGLAASVILAAVIIAGAVYLGSSRRETPAAARREPASTITLQEISGLLEDVRRANLTEDLALWESRCTSAYLAQPGRREGQIDQWRRYDYTSLNFRVDSLEFRNNGASAVVAWDMVLKSASGGETRAVAQQLRSDFVIEDGVVKISGVRRAGP